MFNDRYDLIEKLEDILKLPYDSNGYAYMLLLIKALVDDEKAKINEEAHAFELYHDKLMQMESA